MKKPVLTLVAIALALVTVLSFWLALEEPGRGSREPSASEPVEATAPAADQPLAAAPGSEPGPASATDAGGSELVPASLAADERRAVTGSDTDRTLTGAVQAPPDAPPDETLRVVALDEALDARKVYGVGGALADLAEGKRERVLGTARVDALGTFTLALPEGKRAWLALDGRYLYTSQVVEAAPDVPTVALPAELGACLAGRVRLPAGIADGAGVLEEIDLELGPDSSAFSLGDAEARPLIRRRAALDADGRFELRAVTAGTSHELEVDSDDCADATVGGLELAPGERREIEVVLLRGATLRGSVTDEQGRPIPGAEVAAAEDGFWGFPGEELAEIESGADGSFALEHVQPGKCLVLARHAGHLESEMQRLELADEESREGLVLVLGTGASIAGRVRLPDGTPAAGAQIEVDFDPAALVGMGAMNAARGAEGSAKVGDDGRFEVTGLGKGPFVVAAELERGSGDDGDAWRAKASGVASGTVDLELTLAPPCELAGRVVDLAGAPVAEFRVRVHSAGAVFYDPGKTHEERFQDPAGDFVVRALDAGVWQVEARAEGFGPAAPLEVTLPRLEPEPLVLTLAPAASVAGTVLDPAGAPVSGARVTLQADTARRFQRLRGEAEQPEATSAAGGAFVLEGLAEGTSAILASREGFAASEPVPVELRAAQRTEGVVLHLRRGATVTGEVFGPDGKPAGGAQILAQSPGGLDMAMRRADGQGAFRIENLSPGAWTITALLNERQIDPTGEADDTTAAFLENMRFTMVQLEDGEEEHVVLGAPPKDPVVVRGQVRHGKEPVTAGLVSFFAEGAKGLEALKMSPLGADGRYEAQLNAPGRYVVSVQVTGGSSAFQQHNIEFRATIPEVEEHTLDLALPLGGVRGRVRGADREPLSGARVSLSTEGGIELGSLMGGQYSEATTDEAGNYSFAYLRPGTYAVAAGGALFGGAFGTESSAGRVVRAGLRVEEGRTLEGVDFDLEQPCDIEGKVVDALGTPVKDAAIFVRDSSGRLLDRFSMIASGADGSFQYTGVAPGEYLVSARARELASPESAPVRVAAGGSSSVQLVLYPGTKLEIEVLDEDDKPVQVRISVVDAHGRELQGMVGWSELAASFSAGIDGSKQTVGPLPPGAYTVTAVAADGRKASKPVNLDGQPERKLKLRLR